MTAGLWSFVRSNMTLRVALFVLGICLFPFIASNFGASLRIFHFQAWKILWLFWLCCFSICLVLRRKLFFDGIRRQELVFWIFIAYMLLFGPAGSAIIDPWKNAVFCSLAVIFTRLFVMADVKEIVLMAKYVVAFWWAYALALMLYVHAETNYPGCIQHQFLLSGVLGFAAGLLLAGRQTFTEPRRVFPWAFLATVLANLYINSAVTIARSVIPFSLALVLVAAAWLLGGERRSPRLARRLGLPLALLISLSPVLHLSGALGNIVNEWAYPLWGKIRTVESGTGREATFQIWCAFLAHNARALGPTDAELPAIYQEDNNENTPLFELSSEEFVRIRQIGLDAQVRHMQREEALLAKPTQAEEPPKRQKQLAVTSSHNLWLDATARGGVVYALTIICVFAYVVWLICNPLAQNLPLVVAFSYWTMATAWGFASQFDDEHWLYHIPFLTLFFIPIFVTSLRSDRAAATQANPVLSS